MVVAFKGWGVEGTGFRLSFFGSLTGEFDLNMGCLGLGAPARGAGQGHPVPVGLCQEGRAAVSTLSQPRLLRLCQSSSLFLLTLPLCAETAPCDTFLSPAPSRPGCVCAGLPAVPSCAMAAAARCGVWLLLLLLQAVVPPARPCGEYGHSPAPPRPAGVLCAGDGAHSGSPGSGAGGDGHHPLLQPQGGLCVVYPRVRSFPGLSSPHWA